MPLKTAEKQRQNLFSAVYTFIVSLGVLCCRGVEKAVSFVFGILRAPVVALLFLWARGTEAVRAGVQAAGAGKRGVVRYVCVCLLPVLAAGFLWVTSAEIGARSVGLRVSAGETVLGYLRSENEFLQAKNDALQVLCLGTDGDFTDALPETSYAVELIDANRFTSAEDMREALLRLSSVSTEEACGVYIDGEFLCAVKNQSDAMAVFNGILQADRAGERDAMLSFVQHIAYVQGRYPANGDVLLDRAALQSLAEDLLKTHMLDVKELKTEIDKEMVDYPSVQIPSDALYIGTTRVLSAGRRGSDQVTKLVTYVDGERTGEEEVSRLTVIPPVSEQVQVGTRALDASFVHSTSYGGILIWPAVGATNINSDYAWRWGKLHAALDIGSKVGTSLGKTVVAAAEGTVVIAGVHSSYGYYVKIDHGNGMQTLYAHCMAGSLLVRVGDHVDAGTPIAQVGMTGYATGPHLHFEVIINGVRVDPKPYLGI